MCTRLLTSLLAAAIACNGIKLERDPLRSGRVLRFLLRYFNIDIRNSKSRGNK